MDPCFRTPQEAANDYHRKNNLTELILITATKKLSKKLTQKVTHCKNVCYICVVATKNKLKNVVNKL